MKLIRSITRLGIGLSALLFIATAEAGIPLWTMTPIGNTKVFISQGGGTATVRYLVTNNTTKIQNLVIKPRLGVSQTSLCLAAPRGSANSSCILTLSITGALLPVGNTFLGPELCQANPNGIANLNQCYQPNIENGLVVNVIKAITMQDVAGAYELVGSSSSANNPPPGFIQAQIAIGQFVFNLDGTGVINSIAGHVVNGSYEFIPDSITPFTYTLDSLTGQGNITAQTSFGTVIYKVAFKMHQGIVTGASMIIQGPLSFTQQLLAITSLFQVERFD